MLVEGKDALKVRQGVWNNGKVSVGVYIELILSC